MRPLLLAGPTAEPISLVDAKAWLRVDGSDEDDAIAALVTSARLVVEAATRVLLMTQGWRLVLDRWPPDGIVHVPLAPFGAVTAMRVYDAAGVSQTVPPDLYQVDGDPAAARIGFVSKAPAPGRAMAGIEVDLLIGYGAEPAQVPEPLRQAIRLLVSRWFENRGDVEADTARGGLPPAVAGLIAPYRHARLI